MNVLTCTSRNYLQTIPEPSETNKKRTLMYLGTPGIKHEVVHTDRRGNVPEEALSEVNSPASTTTFQSTRRRLQTDTRGRKKNCNHKCMRVKDPSATQLKMSLSC